MIFLVPISLVLLGVAVWAFIWAVRRGQFDDLETPAVEILVDEPRPEPPATGHDDGTQQRFEADAVSPPVPTDDERHPPRAD